jgi:hypothetical protein
MFTHSDLEVSDRFTDIDRCASITLVFIDNPRSKREWDAVLETEQVGDAATRFKNNTKINVRIKFRNNFPQLVTNNKTMVSCKRQAEVNTFLWCQQYNTCGLVEPLKEFTNNGMNKLGRVAI